MADGAHPRTNRPAVIDANVTGDTTDSGHDTLYNSSRSRVTWDGSVNTRHQTSRKDIPQNLLPQPEMFDESCAPTSDEIRKYTIKQSHKIGGRRWILIAKSLGIKTHEMDKPWIGTVIYIFTLLTGFSYFASKFWYTVYDIKSKTTPATVFTGTVDIIMALFWVASGIYAHALAGDLFSNPRFRDSVRVHSKTLFGLSAIKVTILLAIIAMSLDVLKSYPNVNSETCAKVTVTPVICKLMFTSRVAFSLVSCIWNLLCASVLFSVGRTHTIVLRRFIKELEKDGLLFELGWAKRREEQLMQHLDITELPDAWRHTLLQRTQSFINSVERVLPEAKRAYQFEKYKGEYLWDDDIPSFPTNFQPGSPTSNTIPININNIGSTPNGRLSSSYADQVLGQSYDSHRHIDMMVDNDPFLASSDSHRHILRNLSVNSATSDNNGSMLSMSLQREPGMLSVSQILISWWKLQCRLHISSLALQRWLFCWIVFIIIISVHYIIMWLRQEPTVNEVFEFIIPILLLPLLCSAYAEVNYECTRVTRAIVPIAERLQLLRYMLAQPLQLTMFGSPVSYSTIATVITAVGVAFATKIIFDEFSGK